jgi:signal transduction histidine kinase
MFLSVPIVEGVILDAKMVMGLLAGFFGGTLTGVVTGLIAVLTRLSIGGIGALPGSAGVAVAVAAGALMGSRYRRKRMEADPGLLFILGCTAALVQNLATLVFIPIVGIEQALAIARITVAPSILVYVPATMAVGAMIAFIDDRSLAHRELKEARDLLEERIAGRTAELESSNRELKDTLESLKETRDQLLLSEKLASLGKLTAGIGHELNTPLGAISSSARLLQESFGSPMIYFLDYCGKAGSGDFARFRELLAAALSRSLEDIESADRRLKKEARLFLAEGPLAGRRWAADLIAEYGLLEQEGNRKSLSAFLAGRDPLGEMRALLDILRLKQSADLIATAADRAAFTVGALQNYNRSGIHHPMENIDPAEELETVLSLFGSRTRKGVSVIRDYDPRARIRGSRLELSHLWMNLISNALLAMEYSGTLRLSIKRNGERVLVGVEDDGHGIPEEIAPRIFDPFFTTRKDGAGIGLGLDICRNVVENHKGTIRFTSSSRGTRFEADFPEADADE